MKVRYRSKARLDIENIHFYLEQRSPRAAADVVARIRSAADRLGTWPHMGHAGLAPGTYEWVVVGLPYIIVYEIVGATDEVAIIAVFHGKQQRPDQSNDA